MKTIRFRLGILLLLIFIGCSSSDDSPPIEEIDNGTIEVSINNALEVALNLLTVVELNNEISINGTNCDENIQISLSIPLEIGTHLFNETSSIFAVYKTGEFWPCSDDFFSVDFTTFNSIDGSVTLEEINSTRIKGTFIFNGKSFDGQMVSITQGIFDVKRN